MADATVETLAAPESPESDAGCHWSDCARSDEACPSHGIAYVCGCDVDIPDHCDREGPQLVCCEYLPSVEPALPCGVDQCVRLDDQKLCPTAIPFACRCLPPHCQWAGDGVACCMPLI